MTTAAPPRDPAAPPRNAGSEPTAPPENRPKGAPAGDFTCDVCGRNFNFKLALFNHRKTHDRPPGDLEPEIKVRKTSKLSQKELGELQGELAENVRALGGIMRAGLMSLKVLRLQHPEARLRIPRTRIELPLPPLETHLPYTLISRSELTAKVLVEHAAENETLLRWLVRFNGWFRGGEVGELVAAHAAGAVLTAGVQAPLVTAAAGAVIGDVMAEVERENAELRHQVAQLQARMAAEAAVRPPGDERGAGG